MKNELINLTEEELSGLMYTVIAKVNGIWDEYMELQEHEYSRKIELHDRAVALEKGLVNLLQNNSCGSSTYVPRYFRSHVEDSGCMLKDLKNRETDRALLLKEFALFEKLQEAIQDCESQKWILNQDFNKARRELV
tara:strand:- start:71 stop:478 length:408 start_codon:yes stop_codon:yes gene_type:complete